MKIKVLFICHGNICRSPAAELICKKLLKEKNLDAKVEVISRATSTEELGYPIYPSMRSVLHAHGFHTDGHIARQMTPLEASESDYIIAMDSRNMQNLRRMISDDLMRKVHLLSEYARNFKSDVEDPWYTGNFESVYAQIEDGVSGFVDFISRIC